MGGIFLVQHLKSSSNNGDGEDGSGSGSGSGSSPPACSGGLVAPDCNRGMWDGASPPEIPSEGICSKRFIKDDTNSTSGYLQCKLSAGSPAVCEAWGSSDKSDKQECSVEGHPKCRTTKNSNGVSALWHGYDSTFRGNPSELEMRNVIRTYCRCKGEAEEGLTESGENVHLTTNYNDSKNSWVCKTPWDDGELHP